MKIAISASQVKAHSKPLKIMVGSTGLMFTDWLSHMMMQAHFYFEEGCMDLMFL